MKTKSRKEMEEMKREDCRKDRKWRKTSKEKEMVNLKENLIRSWRI